MRKLLIIVLLFGLGFAAQAKDGYKIKVTFQQDIPDSVIYLAKYYAKPPPTIYKIDSAVVHDKRTADFEASDSILGGIYLVLFEKNSKYAEVIMDNGLNTAITIDAAKTPIGMTFSNSPENTHYADYQKDAEQYGQQFQALNKAFETAKTAADSQRIRDDYKKLQGRFNAMRSGFADKYPKSFVANVFHALETPELPEGKHYLPDGKTIDSLYAFNYMRQHYWDKFDFTDNRLIHTPVYDGKLNDYFTNYVYPMPDSFNKEADSLLERTRGAKELFKYTLHFLAGYAERSKVMGMDEVFVHLVENYYMKGDAFWLDSAQLAKYEDRAQKIAPNVLGNPAPALNLKDVFTLENITLDNIQAPYTLVVFWSPECGHCKKEIPQVDSAYEAVLKSRGVKVLSVPTEGTLDEIKTFIKDHHLNGWEHAVEPNASTYRAKYDVYSTPKIYLLDENKTIIGKGLDHSNILQVIEFNERKKKKG